jgi:hypothetical protein
MSDGTLKNEHHIDSTAPTQPFFQFAPANMRDIIQRQIQSTVSHEVDLFADLSIGDFDGRFLNQYPGDEVQHGDDNGNYFFIVGASRVGDLSVAAP